MPSKIPITTIRLTEPTYSKIRKIAEQNNKKLNQHITNLIKQEIETYEAEHGEIILPDETENP